jgi:hypothetical protein
MSIWTDMIKHSIKNKRFVYSSQGTNLSERKILEISPSPSPSNEYVSIAKIIPKISGNLKVLISLSKVKEGSERGDIHAEARYANSEVIEGSWEYIYPTETGKTLALYLEDINPFNPIFIFFKNGSLETTKTLATPNKVSIEYWIETDEYLEIKPTN